jgi:putative toxin-antitoxin system antitoxin component (TIGR02293 family)
METHTSPNKDVARYLAEKREAAHAYVVLLGMKAVDFPELIRAIEKGLTWRAFERFRATTRLSAEQLGEMISVPRRTLARRRTEGRLAPDESDRLIRAARVYGRALRLFDGDTASATEFMITRNLALGDVTPLQFLRTEIGAREVEHVIGRAEHGIFS